VDAQVLGEHGTSQVFLWSSARVAGMPIQCAFDPSCGTDDELRRDVENEVRYANITIIEGIGASQLGIGVAAARIAERSCATSRPSSPSARSFRSTASPYRCRAWSAAGRHPQSRAGNVGGRAPGASAQRGRFTDAVARIKTRNSARYSVPGAGW